MLGGVDLGRPQIGDQQLLAAEHVERQKAVVVVVAMEKAPFLATMHRHVGGVEIEDELLRWCAKGRDKLLDQHPVEGHRGGTIGSMLESAQGRRTRQRRDAIDRGLQRQVVPQLAMVVEIFVTECQAV